MSSRGAESIPLRSAVLASAVAIAFQLAAKATRDALFLTSFGITSLPRMVALSAVASVLVAIWFTRALSRVGPGVLVPRLFAWSGVALAGEWVLATVAPNAAAIVVYLHITGCGALVISGFWALVNERFDPRAARRSIGWITAAASFGGLLGGLITERMGAILPTTAMLPVLSVLHLTAAILVLPLARSGLRRQALHRPAPVEPPLQIFARSSYLRWLAGLIALTATAEGLLDYVFKFGATQAAGQGVALLRLFALLYTGSSLLSILIQVTLLRRVLRVLSVAQSAALLPVGVGLGALGIALAPGLLSVGIARATEMVMRNSFFRSAQELLYSPVSPADRRATKPLIDVGAARLGDIAGAGMIQLVLLAAPGYAIKEILVAMVVISIAALGIARRLHVGYVRALVGRLRAREEDLANPEDIAAAAVLQTAGAMDLTSVLSFPPEAQAPPKRPVPEAAPKELSRLQILGSRDSNAVRAALRSDPLDSELVRAAVPLLAWDAVVPEAIAALKAVAGDHLALLTERLLDPDEEFAVRRRLIMVLASCERREAFDALLAALNDQRFEVRFRAGRGLTHLAERVPMTEADRARVIAAVGGEVAVERGVWEGRRLIDADDGLWSLPEADILRARANRSLEHVFTLLTLVLPGEPVRLAYRGLFTDDPQLRGIALEYLESVLPDVVRERLWPYLEEEARLKSHTGRAPNQVLDELLASRESIVLAIAAVRRQSAPHQAPD